MRIDGTHYRTIWPSTDRDRIHVIDQRVLPHAFEIVTLSHWTDARAAIARMTVRGAPLIGATGAWGYYLAARLDPGDAHLLEAFESLCQARPTAVNLRWALEQAHATVMQAPPATRAARAEAFAHALCEADVAVCEAIGATGLELVRAAAGRRTNGPVNILTHCNAGWLGCVDWGTALAPIYKAHEAGLDVHVWVDETRPRNQGASLTAWELRQHGVPHTVIVDNAGGHLMQHGQVDMCIVGTDRVTRTGDVCNKIGTYLKALAAFDNEVPFYVALPSSTIDWDLADGLREVPIEERASSEVSEVYGELEDGRIARVRVTPDGTECANPAFDVTPARLITALITERGLTDAGEEALRARFRRFH